MLYTLRRDRWTRCFSTLSPKIFSPACIIVMQDIVLTKSIVNEEQFDTDVQLILFTVNTAAQSQSEKTWAPDCWTLLRETLLLLCCHIVVAGSIILSRETLPLF